MEVVREDCEDVETGRRVCGVGEGSCLRRYEVNVRVDWCDIASRDLYERCRSARVVCESELCMLWKLACQ